MSRVREGYDTRSNIDALRNPAGEQEFVGAALLVSLGDGLADVFNFCLESRERLLDPVVAESVFAMSAQVSVADGSQMHRLAIQYRRSASCPPARKDSLHVDC